MLTPDERARLALHLELDAEWQQRLAHLNTITLPRLRERRIAEELERFALGRNLINPARVRELEEAKRMRPLRYPQGAGVV